MGRMVKCPFCEQKLNKDEAYTYKKRYYHVQCFKTWQRESVERKELIDYICKLYGLETPTGMMLKQIKDFHDDYKYKYKGMELALQYFHETLGNPIQEGGGIGIIPYVYEDAKKYYVMKLKVEQSVKKIGDKQNNGKTVEVESPKFTYKRNIQSIDISSL